MWLIALFGCGPTLPAPVDPVASSPVSVAVPLAEPDVPYADRVDALARIRARLSDDYAHADRSGKAAVRDRARQAVLDGITRDLIPAWYGTRWDFYGTTEVPGEGTIACGYFVTTILRDAGFRVERVHLAQQASENIAKSLAPADAIERFRRGDVGAVVDAVRSDGEGLYVVGLDYHVGFLWNDGSIVRMCHASYLGEAVVVCEDARTSPAMVSGYHVVGKLLSDVMTDRWLTGQAFPTVKR